MANPYLIIDGYNLMHAAGIARRNYAVGDLERCRRLLELRVASSLSDEAMARTTIVYDAFDSPGNEDRAIRRHGLKILYAAQGEDADGEIERMLDHHSAPRQVIIVSSDHRLHKAARRRRARCVDSDVYLQQLESEPGHRSIKSSRRPIKPTVETEAELQQWEATFQVPPETPTDNSSAFDREYLKQLERDLKDGKF